MEDPIKRKVTSKLTINDNRVNAYRPPSPVKSTVSTSASVIRPKAKVNSSATPASARTKVSRPVSSVSSVSRIASRPASPTKSYIAKLARPQPSSRPGTPTQSGSLSARQTSPPLGLGLSNGSLASNSIFSPPSDDLPVKIKSKISRAALTNPLESLSQSLSPSGYARVRAPSISSSHSLSSTTSSTKPEYTLYTTTSAHNTHLYSPNRPAESSLFRDDSSPRVGYKADPVSIPLPTHSPPTSAVSYSSRSSVSRSSASSSTSVSTHHVKSLSGGFDLRSTLDSLVQISESDPGSREDVLSPIDNDDVEDQDRKARNEAKVNRKIADLEITNRSLLAINSTLEATKHRQAKEIRELRRRLRESRLILPPATYRKVTSNDKDALVPEEEDDEEDEEDGAAEEDQTFMRVRILVDEMIGSAKAALVAEPVDLDGKTSTKVLSEQEVRDWRGDGGVDSLEVDENEKNVNQSTQISRTPSRNEERKHDAEEITSEDEVEAMTLLRDSPSPPPIVVHVVPSA